MDYCSGSISTIPAWWIFWLCTLVNLPKRSMSQMSGTPSAETSKDKLFFSSISPLLSVVTFNFSDLSSVSGLFWFELVFGKNGSVTSLVLIVETVFGFKCGTVVDSFWVEITVVDLVPFSALREWVLDSREVKSEEKMSFTLFEKCKWKKNDLRSRSRNESEMKMTENRDREVKVKWKSFEIEIEKWNFSRIFENLKRTDFDLSERVHLEVISFLYVIC